MEKWACDPNVWQTAFMIWYDIEIHSVAQSLADNMRSIKTSKLLRTRMNIAAECDLDIDSEKLSSYRVQKIFNGQFFFVFSSIDGFIRVDVCGCCAKHTNINHIDSTAKFHSLPFEARTIDKQLIKGLMNSLNSHVAYFCRWWAHPHE